MIFRWFLSSTVRNAVEMKKHVRKLLRAQSDLLSEDRRSQIQESMDQLAATLKSGESHEKIESATQDLQKIASANLIPYPHAGIRENIEVFLVAVAIAMGVRTFFLQPFKIPTGSMQPTLYGITDENLLVEDPDAEIPGFFKKTYLSWFKGTSYYHVQAKESGVLNEMDERPTQIFPLISKYRFRIGSSWHTVWFPSDENFARRAGLRPGEYYEKGEDVIKLKVRSGDHLFVDRFTYNFRKPKRGEIIVFETQGIPMLKQDTFYIKRLVGLGGEEMQMGDDQHVSINGKRLDASVPHFENVYTFDKEWKPDSYFGHANMQVVRDHRVRTSMENFKYFPNKDHVFKVRENHFVVLGDNTMNSFDSRGWGDFPQEKVIGQSFFVYWPISERFGWSHR
jgi:signal peptidase I